MMDSANPQSSTATAKDPADQNSSNKSSVNENSIDQNSDADAGAWGPQDFLGHVKRHKRDAANRFALISLLLFN